MCQNGEPTPISLLQHPSLADLKHLCEEFMTMFKAPNYSTEVVPGMNALCRGLLVLSADYIFKVPSMSQPEVQEYEQVLIRMIEIIIPQHRQNIAAKIAKLEEDAAKGPLPTNPRAVKRLRLVHQ